MIAFPEKLTCRKIQRKKVLQSKHFTENTLPAILYSKYFTETQWHSIPYFVKHDMLVSSQFYK